MASTYLSRTPASAGNRKTWTFSAWIKRSKLSVYGSTILFGANSSAGSNDEDAIAIEEANNPRFLLNNGSASSIKPSRLLRDTSAWYHIVVAVDTTQATASNRVKYYFNGELETSFSQESYPSQNYDCKINSNVPQGIGFIDDGVSGSSNYFDGSMAHVHFIDGTAYDADTFGETDATTGIWKPKTAPSVTYGTNGFFLKFENSGAFGTDSSGNANNFTVNGTMTQTIDTPSNVFATLNLLLPNAETFSNGNTTYTNGSGANWRTSGTTLAPTSGKYYCEIKITENGGATQVGLMDMNNLPSNLETDIGSGNWSWSYYSVSGNKRHDGSSTSYGDSFTTGDIIGIAMDLDNLKLYFSKNGTWQNSGDPTSGATGTGSAFDLDSGASYAFAISSNDTGTNPVQDCNFGNGYFGTTAVSSAQNPDDGIGIFEYDVPTGYRALCTKSINAEEYS